MYTRIHLKVRLSLFAFFLTLFTLPLLAGEGMWIPLLLKSLNEGEMKSMGMKMDAEDIYSVNQGSLKDAIVHFAGFCTGEIISDQGLMLTNHHCGYEAIQSHSTLEKNYLKDGFWAASLKDEIPSPGLYAKFIVRIEDVTEGVFKGVKDDMTQEVKDSIMRENAVNIQVETEVESWQVAQIRSFFEGNQFFLFVTETYNDVRYVGSPPESIGKFGADTDNWVWPRHTGDFSLFRVYAGPDNKPADYSPDNKPYKPKHFLPISLDGIDEGDFTLIFGFPGRTNQYLPSYAIEQVVDIIDPARISVRDISLNIMDKSMRNDEATRLAYSSKYARLSNYWKKWIGEVQGLKKANAVEEKQKQEAKFTAALRKNKKLRDAYGDLLPKMQVLYKDLDLVAKNRSLLSESLNGRNIELFNLANYGRMLKDHYNRFGDQQNDLNNGPGGIKKRLEGFYKDYSPDIDRNLFANILFHLSQELDKPYLPSCLSGMSTLEEFDQWTQDIFSSTGLNKKEDFITAINSGAEAFNKWLEADTAYQVFMNIREVYVTLSAYNSAIYGQINPLQTDYVTALMKVYPDRRFWPDANSTLRVSYGQVEGFSPKDGLMYKTQTYLDGVMEKHIPGDYEFDVSPKLIELYENKDYGPYGENGKMPVCFIASNHSTGGNSGSPAIDAHGNLIGLNFDRVWEGTMSDMYYDRSICRNIMVDARYILFVVDKLGGATRLIDEMNLVHPKS